MDHLPNTPYPSSRRLRSTVLLICAGLLFGSAWLVAVAPEDETVTPATGRSWLATMGKSMASTALGRAGTTGEAPRRPAARETTFAQELRHGVVVSGQDLYRFGCRSCHGAGGAGLPPEILPLAPGVRATSVVIQERIDASRGAEQRAALRAQRADLALRHRLQEGGAAMPSFDHFSAQEVEVLLSYLREISGVEAPSGAPAPTSIRRSVERVGEHVVKGTCQVCHDAKVVTPGRREPDRRIPPLAAIPERYSIQEFVAKARQRKPVELGRGMMPELHYFHDAEIEAAYLYLAAYPPR